MFKNKKILFISARFFNYEEQIKCKLEELGAEVYFEDERPSNSFLSKLFIRVYPRIIHEKIKMYYEDIFNRYREKEIDYIFFIKAEAVPKESLEKIIDCHPDAKKILYLWDSLHYNPNAKKVLELFDVVYSFDLDDCDSEKKLSYQPLFYSDPFKKEFECNIDYDWCFIGSIHTDRYKILRRLIIESKKKNFNYYIYCYYPSKALYFARCLFDWSFLSFTYKQVKFKSLTLDEISEIMSRSNVIVDINRKMQRGMTMRSIETLGAKKKLLTTNNVNDIKGIFPSDSVGYLERENVELDIHFLKNNVSKKKFLNSNYSVEGWLKKIFNNV